MHIKDFTVKQLMVHVNQAAKQKGWWDGWEDLSEEQRFDKAAGKLLLVHAEVSEAAEEMRNINQLREMEFDLSDIYYMDDVRADVSSHFVGKEYDDDGVIVREWYNKPEGLAVELADVVIRVFDLAEQLNLPLDRAIQEKITFNNTRSRKHGGKAF
jgi:NTP pyrophosphatase (non-canonical NTP hydrolase)